MFKIEHVLRSFQEKVEEIELLKNQLENQLDEELHDIQEQRAALDRREKEAKANMVLRDHEHTTKLSCSLASSISEIIWEDVKLGDGEDQQAFVKGGLESMTDNATQTILVLGAKDKLDDKTLDSMSYTEDCGGISDEAIGEQDNYLDAQCEQSS